MKLLWKNKKSENETFQKLEPGSDQWFEENENMFLKDLFEKYVKETSGNNNNQFFCNMGLLIEKKLPDKLEGLKPFFESREYLYIHERHTLKVVEELSESDFFSFFNTVRGVLVVGLLEMVKKEVEEEKKENTYNKLIYSLPIIFEKALFTLLVDAAKITHEYCSDQILKPQEPYGLFLEIAQNSINWDNYLNGKFVISDETHEIAAVKHVIFDIYLKTDEQKIDLIPLLQNRKNFGKVFNSSERTSFILNQFYESLLLDLEKIMNEKDKKYQHEAFLNFNSQLEKIVYEIVESKEMMKENRNQSVECVEIIKNLGITVSNLVTKKSNETAVRWCFRLENRDNIGRKKEAENKKQQVKKFFNKLQRKGFCTAEAIDLFSFPQKGVGMVNIKAELPDFLHIVNFLCNEKKVLSPRSVNETICDRVLINGKKITASPNTISQQRKSLRSKKNEVKKMKYIEFYSLWD